MSDVSQSKFPVGSSAKIILGLTERARLRKLFEVLRRKVGTGKG